MEARKYDRKIEIWKQVPVDDGIGGTVPEDVEVKKVWAMIATAQGNKFQNFGITDFKNPTTFQVRGKGFPKDFNENYFIMYQNKKYFVKGVDWCGCEGIDAKIYCDES
jgi:SPP1 family predicted phage head-tail adaptor